MKLRVLEKLKGKGDKKLFQNFLHLLMIQGVEMVLPILTIPYIISVVGLEIVGKISFYTAVSLYFSIIINYGFALSGTRQISLLQEDRTARQNVYNEVQYSKMVLLAVTVVIALLISQFFSSLQQDSVLFALTFANAAVAALIPYWYFQGLQDLKLITRISSFSRIGGALALFVLLRQKTDYLWVVGSTLIANGLILVCALYLVHTKGVVFCRTPFRKVRAQLQSGFYVFLSQVKITFFTNFTTLVIGILLGNLAVGIYTSAEKIIKLLSALQVPVVNTLFPYFSQKLRENTQAGFAEIKKISVLGTLVYVVVGFFVFLFAEKISYLLFAGQQTEMISFLIRMMLPVPVFIFINNLFGTQYLLNVGMDKIFTLNLLLAAAFNVLLVLPLTYYFELSGTAISILLTELLVVALMYLGAKKHLHKQVG